EARGGELAERGFDFSKDYRIWVELGQTLIERAQIERGPERRAERLRLLGEARACFETALGLDPENLAAHYNLARIGRELGDAELERDHAEAYERYRPDDNARDRAVAIARRNDPAANHAAEAIVVYDLQRPGAFGGTP
ncbi:MAG TPA: hypothetical protein VLA66_00030, partial [Thermoanaerobaculia bacterium]|nr:hypothetical protein [Thermoanaerobaculia bacterium]